MSRSTLWSALRLVFTINLSVPSDREALGASRPRRPGRSATLIEKQRPSIEPLVCFDHIVTAASGLLFLRGFLRVNSLLADRDLLQRRRLSDKWVRGSRSQISVKSISAPIRKSRRSSPYSAKYLLIIGRDAEHEWA